MSIPSRVGYRWPSVSAIIAVSAWRKHTVRKSTTISVLTVWDRTYASTASICALRDAASESAAFSITELISDSVVASPLIDYGEPRGSGDLERTGSRDRKST